MRDRKIPNLILNGKTYTPYAYREPRGRGTFVIEAKLRLTRDEFQTLRKLGGTRPGDPLQVIREGFDTEPIPMTRGYGVWSVDGEDIKWLLVLQKQEEDVESTGSSAATVEQPHDYWPQGADSNSQFATHITHLRIMQQRLLDALVAKGVLSEEEKSALVDFDVEELLDWMQDFYLVPDIDRPGPH